MVKDAAHYYGRDNAIASKGKWQESKADYRGNRCTSGGEEKKKTKQSKQQTKKKEESKSEGCAVIGGFSRVRGPEFWQPTSRLVARTARTDKTDGLKNKRVDATKCVYSHRSSGGCR